MKRSNFLRQLPLGIGIRDRLQAATFSFFDRLTGHQPGAPPPEMTNLFLTRHLTTQRASWRERWASSIINLLEPRITMETVAPWSKIRRYDAIKDWSEVGFFNGQICYTAKKHPL